MKAQMSRKLQFDQGTLTLEGFDANAAAQQFPSVPWGFDLRVNQFRTDALWYHDIEQALLQSSVPIENQVKRWQAVAWSCNRLPPLRIEQQEAVTRFMKAGKRGVIVMPTGTGKTAVALEIARQLKTACLFVAPVRDLMYQWQRRLLELLNYDAGVIGDNLFDVRAVSVTTYDSATIHANQLGNRFGLVVFDECHHLPGRYYREAALMSAAPFRLGLTATPQRSDGKHEDLAHLIGPKVFELSLKAVTGRSLANYQVVRIPVKLSGEEQRRYDELSRTISDYVCERREEDNRFVWAQLCRETNADSRARTILKAFHQKQAIENRAQEKLRVLEDLFRLHAGEPILVFVGSNSMARQVSLRFLVPCLLSHCGKKERQEILSGFETGVYPVIVANQILDEGVDLPEAKVAVVIGGSSSTRQAKQRLGRILRKSASGNATLYEVVLDETNENRRSRARRRSDAFREDPAQEPTDQSV